MNPPVGQSSRSVVGLIFVAAYIFVAFALILFLVDQKFNALKRDKLIQDEKYDPQIRQAAMAAAGIESVWFTPEGEDFSLRFHSDSLRASGGVYQAARENKVYTFPLSLPAEQLHDQIAEKLQNVIRGDNIFIRAEFYPCIEAKTRVTANEPAVVVEDLEKRRRANTISNSLFTRSFENLVLYRMGMGNVRLYYTSPTDAEWMAPLLARYRLYALVVVVLGLAALGIVAREMVSRLRRAAPPVQGGR